MFFFTLKLKSYKRKAANDTSTYPTTTTTAAAAT